MCESVITLTKKDMFFDEIQFIAESVPKKGDGGASIEVTDGRIWSTDGRRLHIIEPPVDISLAEKLGIAPGLYIVTAKTKHKVSLVSTSQPMPGGLIWDRVCEVIPDYGKCNIAAPPLSLNDWRKSELIGRIIRQLPELQYINIEHVGRISEHECTVFVPENQNVVALTLTAETIAHTAKTTIGVKWTAVMATLGN